MDEHGRAAAREVERLGAIGQAQPVTTAVRAARSLHSTIPFYMRDSRRPDVLLGVPRRHRCRWSVSGRVVDRGPRDRSRSPVRGNVRRPGSPRRPRGPPSAPSMCASGSTACPADGATSGARSGSLAVLTRRSPGARATRTASRSAARRTGSRRSRAVATCTGRPTTRSRRSSKGRHVEARTTGFEVDQDVNVALRPLLGACHRAEHARIPRAACGGGGADLGPEVQEAVEARYGGVGESGRGNATSAAGGGYARAVSPARRCRPWRREYRGCGCPRAARVRPRGRACAPRDHHGAGARVGRFPPVERRPGPHSAFYPAAAPRTGGRSSSPVVLRDGGA